MSSVRVFDVFDCELDQLGRSLEVCCGERMAYRLGPVAVGVEPGGGPLVQLDGALRRLIGQPRAQHVGEEVVVAEPLPTVVERTPNGSYSNRSSSVPVLLVVATTLA